MIKKIPRDICIIKYRKLPLCEYDKELDEDVCYYPEIHSFYWLKLKEGLKLTLEIEIVLLLKKLKIDTLIFLGRVNKPWVSKFTNSRQDYKPLIKAAEYFKSHKIEKKFNGGVSVAINDLQNFLHHFYVISRVDSGFYDFHFTDTNQNYLFYIHYTGELKVLILNKPTNDIFLENIKISNFVDSDRESWNKVDLQ